MASVVVSLVFALRSAARWRAALHLEILALRHQVAVLNRSRPSRLRLTAADRVLWAWLSRAWIGWRPALVLVKPDTVCAWHRRGFRLFWTWKSRYRTGRPAAAPEHAFGGSCGSVYRFVRHLEPRTPDACVRVERDPGEEAQVDFGYAGLLRDPASDTLRKAWAFVMTLSFSRHSYVEFVFDQEVDTWLRCHRRAFEWFDGVVRRVVLDNLKAAIVQAAL